MARGPSEGEPLRAVCQLLQVLSLLCQHIYHVLSDPSQESIHKRKEVDINPRRYTSENTNTDINSYKFPTFIMFKSPEEILNGSDSDSFQYTPPKYQRGSKPKKNRRKKDKHTATTKSKRSTLHSGHDERTIRDAAYHGRSATASNTVHVARGVDLVSQSSKRTRMFDRANSNTVSLRGETADEQLMEVTTRWAAAEAAREKVEAEVHHLKRKLRRLKDTHEQAIHENERLAIAFDGLDKNSSTSVQGRIRRLEDELDRQKSMFEQRRIDLEDRYPPALPSHSPLSSSSSHRHHTSKALSPTSSSSSSSRLQQTQPGASTSLHGGVQTYAELKAELDSVKIMLEEKTKDNVQLRADKTRMKAIILQCEQKRIRLQTELDSLLKVMHNENAYRYHYLTQIHSLNQERAKAQDELNQEIRNAPVMQQ